MLINPYIAKLIVESRIDDLRRSAGGAPPSRPADEDAEPRAEKTGVPVSVRPFPRLRRAFARASEPCA
jgi:hypothetical protein